MKMKPNNLELISPDHPFKQYCRDFIKFNFNKISQRKIARILQIGKTTVNNWSRSMGYIFQKHTVNENYFNEWSSEMAYILGYIFADGNVAWDDNKGYHTLTITASEKDKEHLETIRKIFDSTKPLTYGKSTKSYRLIVNSRVICKRLMKLGVIPRKSLIIKFPKISNSYLRDFIRGYVDGDGSLSYYNRKRSPYFEIKICSGSKNFIIALEEKIYSEQNIRSRITAQGKNCYILRYFCARGLKLAEWLYEDAELYLVRKYNKYEMALSPRKD